MIADEYLGKPVICSNQLSQHPNGVWLKKGEMYETFK